MSSRTAVVTGRILAGSCGTSGVPDGPGEPRCRGSSSPVASTPPRTPLYGSFDRVAPKEAKQSWVGSAWL